MSVLGEKLIAFLSWIIYLAVFKTCASLAQEVFYNTKVAHLKAACRCRDHGGGRSSSFRSKPGTTGKGTRHASSELLPRTSSSNFFLGAVEEVSEFARTYIVNTNNFVDPLEDPPAAIGSEAAAAAAAMAVAAGRPNGPGAGSASAATAGAAPPAAAV